MEVLITIEFRGGLGNQLFEAAFGLALEKAGYQVQFSTKHCINGNHREYSMGRFERQFPLVNVSSGISYPESGMRFQPHMLNPPDGALIHGYFQSSKYFEHIADDVRQAFRVKSMSPKAKEYAAVIDSSRGDSVALHVRRGDYVGLQHYHGLTPLSYYQQAKEILGQREYFIFSDDPLWCEENLGGILVHGTDKYDDLQLMSRCSSSIIANSSFSWWSAWLADVDGTRKVIAPKTWFVEPSLDCSDVVPERWMKI